ncbi:dephospho-CoA kinase [Aeromicrobium ginsengisoli]|uniref:Dephospho-CoA kinase n=1 Tax=Aeromicrobium ginsengisoli TaxID=363867 RepID=A0A5M4FHY9_9ACTN|nr:dephospho-CoA kinase [Aeromicrobium ginsengisoli]KAA1399671.1 dephospho-CoA kinase [Aeromicrobium ginsengisoli]
MLRVGLTGGIGSGKSSVSALLAAHGAVVIDYDLLAREAVEPGSPGLEAIAQRFGPGVIAADGSLDRPALAEIVFADPAALADLNGITHPAIWQLAAAREAAAGADDIVVHDNPLLVEMGAAKHCDVVVVVDVPEDVQVARLVESRGMSEDEARARIAAQASRQQRTGAADLVIDNTGPLDELARIVGGTWDELVSRVDSA